MCDQIAHRVISIYFLVVNIRFRLIINSSLIFYELKGSYKYAYELHMSTLQCTTNDQECFI